MSFSNPLDQIKKVEYDDLIYQATVEDNNDPKQLERVRIRIERIHDEVPKDKLPWAYPLRWRNQGSSGGTVGAFGPVPINGSAVFVIFQRGDPHFPLYIAGVIRPDLILELSKTNYPFRYGWVDQAKNEFWIDTKEGSVEFHVKHGPTGSSLLMDNEGNLTIHIIGNIIVNGDQTITVTALAAMALTGDPVSATSGSGMSLSSGATTTISAGGNLNTNSTGPTNIYSSSIITICSAVLTRVLGKFSALIDWLTGVAGGGGGGGGSPPRAGPAAGINLPYGTPGSYLTGAHGGFKAEDTLLFNFTVPTNAPTSTQPGLIQVAESPAGPGGPAGLPYTRQITISDIPNDFREPDRFGINGPMTRQEGTSAGVPFRVGTPEDLGTFGFGTAVVIPGHTYYVSIRNYSTDLGRISADPGTITNAIVNSQFPT